MKAFIKLFYGHKDKCSLTVTHSDRVDGKEQSPWWLSHSADIHWGTDKGEIIVWVFVRRLLSDRKKYSFCKGSYENYEQQKIFFHSSKRDGPKDLPHLKARFYTNEPFHSISVALSGSSSVESQTNPGLSQRPWRKDKGDHHSLSLPRGGVSKASLMLEPGHHRTHFSWAVDISPKTVVSEVSCVLFVNIFWFIFLLTLVISPCKQYIRCYTS